ncbi:hypothetical protein M419DRAFT_140798 [Trichoderma reesei RUT C-30]|uniref:Zn(2)-C6 fungal-type domain-containing protein n=1 Tax=Hypocrea jecorina (strain ATCC 56765 / BCRC 32924 / NRRL 11460 / Rut C-30) TaxID=1344414 RepID=A0A024SDJ1_HYPJR|nr:hypothetical protein M419DRAFT_140798 [Trichoderma reesei RUT C-30]
MASQYSSTAPLPQGFSVYQPQLGAQLQFFPALGTQELDDMINAYIPGSAPLKEKRATISLDFLEHSQLTGQTFKFYPVYYSSSPVAASPVNSIAASSSFSNASPANSALDWSQASASPSVSSRSSVSKSRKASKSGSLVARYPAVDLSHLPGMKIMTKDGQDITDSASRGSKTKEQRDHAHLMRIIKACDSCRRKKIRCDPDHKKRPASQAQPQSAAKSAKKARTTPPAAASPAPAASSTPPPQKTAPASVAISTLDDNPPIPTSLLGLDPTFTFTGLDGLQSNDQMFESWEEFVQYPPADVDDSYDFFLDPEGYFSSQSSATSSSASPPKALTPASQQDVQAAAGPEEREGLSSQSASPQLPFMQDKSTTASGSYTDFNLFSPSSSFSEDDRMVPISSTRLLSPAQTSASGSDPFAFDGFAADGNMLNSPWDGTTASVSPLDTASLVAAAHTDLSWYDPGHNGTESGEPGDLRGGISRTPSTDWASEVRIAYPSGGSVLVTAASGSGDVEVIANSAPPGRSDASGSGSGSGSVSVSILGSGPSAELVSSASTGTALQFYSDIQDEAPSRESSPTERGRFPSEPPVDHSSWLSSGQVDSPTDITSQFTSQRRTTSVTLATTADDPIQLSRSPEKPPSRVQTQLAANRNVTSEDFTGGLQASYGDALHAVPGSTAHATAGEDTLSPHTSSGPTALVWSDRAGVEAFLNLTGLPAQQLNGGLDVHQQAIDPMVDSGLQTLSPPLLQATSPKEGLPAAGGSAYFGAGQRSSQLVVRQVLSMQAIVAILAATLLGAAFASMAGAPLVPSLLSVALATTAIFRRLGEAKAFFETTPSTMSSSRFKQGTQPWAKKPHGQKAQQPSVLRHEVSRLSSRFSSFLEETRPLALIAPLMG